jgi:hypothetical protein
MAMAWVERPPDLAALVAYAINPEGFRNRQAMEIFLARKGGTFGRVLRRFVALRGLTEDTVEEATRIIGQAAAFLVALPLPTVALAEASETALSILHDEYAPEAGVRVRLLCDDGALQVVAESTDPAARGRRVDIAIYGLGEPLKAQVTLKSSGAGAAGRHRFGPCSRMLQRIGPDCLILAWQSGD